MPRVAEVLQGWEWNEALPEGISEFNDGLIALLAFDPDRAPRFIGTGFIVAATGSQATAITAAHNFHEGVHKVQVLPRHNPTALAEFLPEVELVNLDRKNIRAIYRIGDRVEACVLRFAAWDKGSDIAVFTLEAQDAADETLFGCFHRLESVNPAVGDLIAVAGFADLSATTEFVDSDKQKINLGRRLVLRAGRVKAVHMEGHILCRGPCIETTIPVFGGMSGSPAGLIPEQNGQTFVPFGVVSSDPDEPVAIKNDRSRPGSSIISLLPVEIANDTEVRREITLKLMDLTTAGKSDSGTAIHRKD